MATYAELIAQANGLFAEAETVRKHERLDALKSIRAAMQEFGITVADLGGSRGSRPSKPGAKMDRPAQFKGPVGQLWSGLGRYPDWLREELARGRQKSDFKI